MSHFEVVSNFKVRKLIDIPTLQNVKLNSIFVMKSDNYITTNSAKTIIHGTPIHGTPMVHPSNLPKINVMA